MIDVANISGGRSSMYMGLYLYYAGFKGIYCFQNTGMETPETVEFLRKAPFPLVVLQYKDTKPFFTVETLDTMARKGEPFKQLTRKRSRVPNALERFCTGEMKVLTLRRYIRSLGEKKWKSYLGIRADEPDRVVKIKRTYQKNNGKTVQNTPVFPLVSKGITSTAIGEFWRKIDWDIDLPLLPNGKTVMGNCVGCFHKSEAELALTLKRYPDLYAIMESIEKEIGGTFRNGYSMEEFRKQVDDNPHFDFDFENEVYCTSENGSCGD